MLDRVQLVRALRALENTRSAESSLSQGQAQALYRAASARQADVLQLGVESAGMGWYGSWDQKPPVAAQPGTYAVRAVDGSYVYGDRHAPTTCALINYGDVLFSYGEASAMAHRSYPELIPAIDLHSPGIPALQIIEEQMAWGELKALLARSYPSTGSGRAVVCAPHLLNLMDGSLFWWQRNLVRDGATLERLSALLRTAQESRCLYAAYVSAPSGREVVTLLQKACTAGLLPEIWHAQDSAASLAYMNDSQFYRLVLPIGGYSPCFYVNSFPWFQYDQAIRPCFFYLKLPQECARIEVPVWIAGDATLCAWIAACAYDQCRKGGGYPVALAHAHVQAHISAQDRLLFAQLASLSGRSDGQSPKLQRKHLLGV